MIRFLAIVALFETAAAAAPAGLGRAMDGDSLMVGETEVRLHGIDAPEYTQTCQRDGHAWDCGGEAAYQLSKLSTASR